MEHQRKRMRRLPEYAHSVHLCPAEFPSSVTKLPFFQFQQKFVKFPQLLFSEIIQTVSSNSGDIRISSMGLLLYSAVSSVTTQWSVSALHTKSLAFPTEEMIKGECVVAMI